MSGFRERLSALERAADRAHLVGPGCPRCGVARDGGRRLLVVDSEDAPARCPDCGRVVDAEGRALGDGTVKVLILGGPRSLELEGAPPGPSRPGSNGSHPG